MTIKSKAQQIKSSSAVPSRSLNQIDPVRSTSSKLDLQTPRLVVSRSDLFNGAYDIISINHELGLGEYLFNHANAMFIEKTSDATQCSDDVIRFTLNYIAGRTMTDNLQVTSNLVIQNVLAVIAYSVDEIPTDDPSSSGSIVRIKAIVARGLTGDTEG